MSLFFERPDTGERAVLVRIEVDRPLPPVDPEADAAAQLPDEDDELAEFDALVRSAGVEPVAVVRGHRREPSPRTFIGSGKLDEIRMAIRGEDADVVLFDHELSPVQERNLEAELECRVVGRTGVILDIFAQRARTREGRLQVELAQLNHMATRLVRGWTHLDRQKGGIGLRGAGETQLEMDQRIIGERIKSIGKRLGKVRSQRSQGRRARNRASVPTVSLVGYTNAGKSTLFNALTDAGVTAANQLFETLDPTLRRVTAAGLGDVVLADTVGFISRLPHRLVEAFRATLEEVAEADLLLHVMDASAPGRAQQAADVDTVLREIGAAEVPVLEVWNKIDATDLTPGIERDGSGRPLRVRVSALAGRGLDLLMQAVGERLGVDARPQVLELGADGGAVRARLYADGAVLADTPQEHGGWRLSVRLDERGRQRLQAEPSVRHLAPQDLQQAADLPVQDALQGDGPLNRMRRPHAGRPPKSGPGSSRDATPEERAAPADGTTGTANPAPDIPPAAARSPGGRSNPGDD